MSSPLDVTPPFLPLDWQRVTLARHACRIGRRVVYRDAVPSTNDLARALAHEGAADGTIVLADEQTQGRGRLGRRWVAPPRSGLAVSVLLRPPADYPLPALSIAAALAASDAGRGVVGVRCALKWPNDVLVDGAKVAGILLDLEQDRETRAWSVVIGVGINVNAAPDLPGATSLAAATGSLADREALLLALIDRLEHYVAQAPHAHDVLLALWRERLVTLGRRVRVRAPDRVIEGLALDVDRDGALLIRRDDGAMIAVHAGDVTLSE